MSRLAIALLGSFRVSLGGAPLTAFRSDKARALLAYLAVEANQPHRRETLATLFWPDCSGETARNNLRQTLYVLRHVLGDQPAGAAGFLLVAQHEIQFNLASDHWLDVAAFTRLIEPCTRHPERRGEVCQFCVGRLARAVDLYQGDFLTGLSVSASEELDAWARARQEQYHLLVLDTLTRLAGWHERRLEYEQAAGYAQRQIALEPWREEAQRTLMRALAFGGQRSAALHQYELVREILQSTLGVDPAPETVALFNEIRTHTLAMPAGNAVNPYQGLHFFTAKDAPFFFGREVYIEQLAQLVSSRPHAAVIGPSGSGKSSLIFAGLLPRVAEGLGGHPWLVAAFRPGNQPWVQLAAALLPLLQANARQHAGLGANDLAGALACGDLTLAACAKEILAGQQQAARLLLVADQFEELYTSGEALERQRGFVDALLAPASASLAEPSRLNLILSLRADFVDRALAFRVLSDALAAGHLLLGPMSRQELRRVIEEPARVQGVTFETGLQQRLLADVGLEPGRLPLLEFALTLLWERRPNGMLTHAAYDDIGGVHGALARYAEEVYAELDAAEEARARGVFLQLVRPGEQTEDVRRVATRSELGESGWAMAQRLAGARLVVIGQDAAGRETAEIVHEALITGWSRLRGWLDEDRAFRLWQEGLRGAVARWEAGGEDEGALLRGRPLAEAEGWTATRAADVDQPTLRFVAASRWQREQAAQTAEDLRQRELTQARALAATQARASRQLGYVAVGLTLLLALVGAAAALALYQQQAAQRYAVGTLAARATAEAERNLTEAERARAESERGRAETQASLALAAQATAEAERRQTEAERERAESERARAETQAHLALSRQLAAQTGSLMTKQPDLAALLAVEANRHAELAGATEDQANLLLGLQVNPYLDTVLHAPDGVIYDVAYAPPENRGEGAEPVPLRLVARSNDTGIRSWDAATGSPIGRPITFELPSEAAIALGPNGRYAALGLGRSITILTTLEGQPAGPPLALPAAPLQLMIFGSDSRSLYSSTAGAAILRWDLATGISTTLPITDSSNGGAWRVSPDGRLIALVLDPHYAEYAPIVVADVLTGRTISRSTGGHKAADNIHDMAFSPDGRTLATGSYDKTVILWDTATGQMRGPPLTGHVGRVLAVQFSPDGKVLASAGVDGQVLLWDVATGKPFHEPLQGHGNWIRGLAFSPDGRMLASGSVDGKVLQWNLGRQESLPGHTARIRGVSFSPDGRTVASGGFDTHVVLNALAGGQVLADASPESDHSVLSVRISPDGRTLAVGTAGNLVALYDAATLRPLGQPLAGHTGIVVTTEFSPDGKTLATGGFDKTVMLWDVLTQKPLMPPLRGHENWIIGVAFSPDGKTLASGGADGHIILWDVATGRPLGPPLTGHINWVNSLAFSPDGKTLVSGSSDTTIRFWDVATRRPLGMPLDGHEAQVWGVFFDPTSAGRTLISAGADGKVIRWDVATRTPLGPPLLGKDELETLDVSPDGRRVALGGNDGAVHMWQVERAPWTAWACRLANRNLTPEEWQQYLHDEPYQKTCPDLP